MDQQQVPLETRQVVLSATVPAATAQQIVDFSPLTGRITSVTFHFPPGCNALVDVAFWKGGIQISPKQGFLALDDATPTYPMSEPVRGWDRLWILIRNTDAVNQHTPSVIVTIEGHFKPLGKVA